MSFLVPSLSYQQLAGAVHIRLKISFVDTIFWRHGRRCFVFFLGQFPLSIPFSGGTAGDVLFFSLDNFLCRFPFPVTQQAIFLCFSRDTYQRL
jgi:hypothetical protein